MVENNMYGMQYGNHMNPGIQGAYPDSDIKQLCKKYLRYHVIGQTRDGSQIEGIIIDMDEDNMEMLVPEEIDQEETRQYGYGYNDYDYNDYGGYGRRYRRYRRHRFPYSFFGGLFRYPYY